MIAHALLLRHYCRSSNLEKTAVSDLAIAFATFHTVAAIAMISFCAFGVVKLLKSEE
jgi:hypothetical protein